MFFDEPIAESKKNIKIDRDYVMSLPLTPYEEMTNEEILSNTFTPLIFDIECYPNYFLIAFKHIDTGKVITFELSASKKMDLEKLDWIVWRYLLVGFNSMSYDMPMLFMALRETSFEELKRISNRIINNDLRMRQLEDEYKLVIPKTINHVDLIEVAPLKASLKTYAGRMHCQKMQDLPFNPNEELTLEQMNFVKHYCINDLDNTILLYKELAPQLKLRCDMSEQFGIDLRSRSDAQIAEHVLASEIARITGRWPKRPPVLEGTAFGYQKPEWLAFLTPQLNEVLRIVLETPFVVGSSGSIDMPKELASMKVSIGNGVYRMGIGGLHSSEEKIAHSSDENTLLVDRDVASYYPSIILNNNLAPAHMGDNFLEVYQELVDKRLEAKHNKNKVVANSLKIVINGSFGKLGNRYSCLYSPDLLLQVTLTGQLALLMLIEGMETVGIPVVSANTDGIIMKLPKSKMQEYEAIIRWWEYTTSFVTEETRYKAVYSRDVNNYIAIKEDGSVKTKGTYSEKGSANDSVLSKNPEKQICNDAVVALLTVGTPIEDTIINCKDIRRFLTVRNVKGGAHKDGKYLGKVVRFYYSTEEKGTINYISTGNKVPNSDGARPMMNLTPGVPSDLNFNYYIKEAKELLFDIGYYAPKIKSLF